MRFRMGQNVGRSETKEYIDTTLRRAEHSGDRVPLLLDPKELADEIIQHRKAVVEVRPGLDALQ